MNEIQFLFSWGLNAEMDPDPQLNQKGFVLINLCYTYPDRVLEESVGEVGDLLLVKLHPVLHHAGLHHLPQVGLVNQSVI